MRTILLNIAAASLLLGTVVTLAQAPLPRPRHPLARLRVPPVPMLSLQTW